MKRKGLLVLSVIILLVIVSVAAIPFLINAEQFRPRIEAMLSDALARQVRIGSLKLSLLQGGIAATDLAIAEDAKFGSVPFLTAKQVTIGVEMIPLLTSRTVHVQSFSVESPEVRLVRAENGRWNFSSMGTTGASKNGPEAAPLSLDKVLVTNGRIIMASQRGREKPTVYESVELQASNVSAATAFPFKLSMQTPGKGKMTMEGVAGPVGKKDVAETPLEAKVKLQDFDVASTGLLDPGAGIGGVVAYDGTVRSNGKQITSSGTAKVEKLKLVAAGAPANVPVGLEYATAYDMVQQRGALTKGLVRVADSVAKLSGTYDLAGKAPVLAMRLQGEKMPMQDVQTILPALGVILPAGASLQGGTATANLTISGPIDRLVTTGPLNIAQTKLAGFDLGSKLSTIGKLAGINTGSQTEIQLLSSQLRVAPEGIRADGLNLVIPALGTLTGSGTVGANNALDFKMVAQMDASTSVLGAIGTATGLGLGNARVPFSIRGTTKNPLFVPDVMGAFGSGKTAPAKSVGDILGGFFRKKQ